jgi:hypothetical protein
MLYMDDKLRPSAFVVLAMVFLMVVSIPALMASAQQQQQQQSGSSSAASSICKMVQDNRFLAGIAGLDQAISICNNLGTVNSGQVLSQLCSVIGGLKIINVDSICKQQQQQRQTTTNGTTQNQNQTLSHGSVVNNNNSNTNASNSGGSTNSLIDKTMGVLRGYLGK